MSASAPDHSYAEAHSVKNRGLLGSAQCADSSTYIGSTFSSIYGIIWYHTVCTTVQHIEPTIGSTQCAYSSTYVRTHCAQCALHIVAHIVAGIVSHMFAHSVHLDGQPAHQTLCERQRPALYKHMTWYELT